MTSFFPFILTKSLAKSNINAKFASFRMSSFFAYDEKSTVGEREREREKIWCDVRIIHLMFHSRPWHSRKFGTNIHNMATISHCYWQTLQFSFLFAFAFSPHFTVVMCPIFAVAIPSIHTRPNDWHANVKTKMLTSYPHIHKI